MDLLVAAACGVFGAGFVMILFSGRLRKQDRSNARLAAVERKLDLIMKHHGIVEPAPEEPDVVHYLQMGQKIQAIKVYRERTGLGLADAKAAVEKIAAERGL